jgi:hypothetical protein
MVFPMRYELVFYIPEDDILHSHRHENVKSCTVGNAVINTVCNIPLLLSVLSYLLFTHNILVHVYGRMHVYFFPVIYCYCARLYGLVVRVPGC